MNKQLNEFQVMINGNNIEKFNQPCDFKLEKILADAIKIFFFF